MISMTTTWAPADLPGLRGLDVRGAHDAGLCSGLAERAAAPRTAAVTAPDAPAQGTGLPAGSAVRLRPATRRPIGHDVVTTKTFDNNGTTLGNHSSRRPQS